MTISCEIGTVDDVLKIDKQITEFDQPANKASLYKRLEHKKALILIARYHGKLAGYKIGYHVSDNEFYSWLGGVAPQYRQLGIATQLREKQEAWALQAGYSVVTVKSMNRYPAMLQLLINSGYKINGYQDNGNADNSKIRFIKQLG